MLLPVLSCVALLLSGAQAVFADEAWNVDYHHPLLGLPREDTSFFHQPNPHSRASLLYTLSEEGVLGAVNPKSGGIVWRQVLRDGGVNSHAGFLRAAEGQDVVVSGHGSEVSAWSAADGRQAWVANIAGPLEDLEILELADGKEKEGAKDVIALSSGAHPTIWRIDGDSGSVKWQYAIDGSDTPFQLSASATQIYAILLHKTMLGYATLRVIALDPVTGRKVDEYTLSSDTEVTNADTIVSVGANSASPIIAWTDAAYTTLKVNIIGNKQVTSFAIEKHGSEPVTAVRLHAPYHVNSLSHFLIHYETASSHWAEVYHIDTKGNKVSKAYSLPKLPGKGAFSTSTCDANVYFTRITRDELFTVSSASHAVLGRWQLNDYRVPTGAGEIVEPVHAVSEVSMKGDAVGAVRTAVLLSTGDWVLFRDGKAVWDRTEMLANSLAATFVRPVEAEALMHELEAEAHSNPVQAYVHRVRRHLKDLQKLPVFLASLPQKVINGFLGTSAEDATSDSFGFHQVVVCATKNGRLVALNAGDATKILWSVPVADLQPGQSWQPRLASSKAGVLTVSSQAANGVQYNSTTGEQLFSVLPVPEKDANAPRQVSFTLKDGKLDATLESKEAWHFTPSAGERIVTFVPRPINDPVASIGKVLGDRRVLYKYLDPNLALLATAKDRSRTATFYVFNTVSGAVIYTSVHHDVDFSAPIGSIMSENWFAYSFTADAFGDTPKGHQLVIGELFESLIPNDRGALTGKSNYSSLENVAEPFTLTQSYQIPGPISKLGVTQTRQGITSRQILAVLPDSHAIVGIPYGAVDPRRPVGRDPTKDEQMEGLVKYSPTIEFDPKWYLNHQREVVGIKDIVTSPASIESTSLVFAYGLDIFGTRLSPSFSFDILGKDFNKFQMLATVAALAVATLLVAPLVSRSGNLAEGCTDGTKVTRKQVDQRWQFR